MQEVNQGKRNFLARLNPFSPTFWRITDTSAEETFVHQSIQNSVGFGETDEMALVKDELKAMFNSQGNGTDYDVAKSLSQAEITTTAMNKTMRIRQYREMEGFPEISDALDYIGDEAICVDEENRVATLEVRRNLPPDIKRIVLAEWDYITMDVLKLHENGWDYFRRWLVDSELFLEKILNDSRDRIIKTKQLNPTITWPIYSGEEIMYFVQKPSSAMANQSTYSNYTYTSGANYINDKPDSLVRLNATQVAYANFQRFGANYLDIRGFLESAVMPYNWIKNLELALLIYRIVRAPERFLYNVEVGKTPTTKARENMNRLKVEYRKRDFVNPTSGEIDTSKAFMSMVDDIWLMKREGNGSDISTVGGNMNLGEINDVDHFKKKLLTSLKIPKSRWGMSDTSENKGFTRPGEISYEEHKFNQMVQRMRNKFVLIIQDVFFTQLRLDGIPEKYITSDMFLIKFTDSNLFQREKELMILTDQISRVNDANQYLQTQQNPDGLLPFDSTMAKIFGVSEWTAMSEERKKFKESLAQAGQSTEPNPEGEQGDMGGFGGEPSGGSGSEPSGDMGEFGGAQTPEENPSEPEATPEEQSQIDNAQNDVGF